MMLPRQPCWKTIAKTGTTVRPAGVCASDKVAAGKVVFAARAFQYERGKYVKGDQGNTKFQPDFSEEKAKRAQDLENNLPTVKDHPDVFGNMAVMLTGSAVRLDSPPFISQAAENVSRHAVALDMEASAFLAACDVCNVPALGVFKAVLDPMDSTKRQQAANYRLYAARALLFSMRVWRWYFNLPGNMAEQQEELGHNLADAYWRAFMEPVQMAMHLKQGPLGVQGARSKSVAFLKSSQQHRLVAPASLLKFH
ncbi:hypothetical protein WJX72_011355 [[Myrmecia] bisecta]|uniref:Uncharacterized protein n=1 Tax=[Myrmecia] bisecta TaxID=41462 RepID=A0AAW1Q4U5_9CHLO